ncbi:MAG: glycosyltransferase family 2 protein [Patescibacteria group bacterium]|jgi:cellulose synthase/poly-beta-1,6-N-acetylglucosamine synthase-like glycosyltransferase
MFHLSDRAKYRTLEMIPGVAVWSSFLIVILLIFFRPLWAIYFIIVFDFYWMVRVIYIIFYTVVSYKKFHTALGIDWMEKCRQQPNWERMYHMVFLPTYKEPLEVLRMTLTSLTAVDYPVREKMIIVMCFEERDTVNAHNYAAAVQQEFAGKFADMIVSFHPVGIEGEMPGKGANMAWAGRIAKKYVDERGIPYEDILVSAFDVDTCAHPKYFSYLTYQFLKSDRPLRQSYQPVPLFNNNIWEVPAIMRVVSTSTTFWLMSEQLRPERLFTFASHSMSFRALVDVDFWQNDIVTDDSRIFLQCLMKYDGDYVVKPMYIPISMDAVAGRNIWHGMENLYKQQRRWAWGVEHFPYMVWFFAKNNKIALSKKLHYVWNLVEGMYSWATAPIIIFVLGYFPLRMADDVVKSTVIAQNAPFVLQTIMTLAMVGLLVSAVLSVYLLPPKPVKYHGSKFAIMLLQWALLPITMIAFGSIPATEAQTRLMLGKYLGFRVTDKIRSKSAEPAPQKA